MFEVEVGAWHQVVWVLDVSHVSALELHFKNKMNLQILIAIGTFREISHNWRVSPETDYFVFVKATKSTFMTKHQICKFSLCLKFVQIN